MRTRMNRKELKEFFGHSFGQMKKFKRYIPSDNNKFIIYLDRSGNVIDITSVKALYLKIVIEKNHTEYSGEEWLNMLNHKFRGQPFDLCKDSLNEELSVYDILS